MHDRHARTVGGRSPEPSPIFPSRPCSLMEKPANDPRGKGRTHATVSSIAWLGRLRTLMRVIAAIAPFMCEVAGSPVLNRVPAHKLRRILKRSIGSPNSSTRRLAASPSRRAGSVL